MSEGRVEEALHDSIYDDVHFWPDQLSPEELKECGIQMLKQFVPSLQKGYSSRALTKKKPKRVDTAILMSATMDEDLQNLVGDIQKGYHPLVYHNFAHAIDVTQLMFSLLTNPSIKLPSELGNREKFYMLFACLCHDIGHFGLGNGAFNKELQTCSFGDHYGIDVCGDGGDKTIVENLHVEKTIEIIETHPFFAKDELAGEVANTLKVWVTSMILATDLSKQKFFLNCIKNWNESPFTPFSEDSHLRAIPAPGPIPLLFIKLADMGNVFRDYECAKLWTQWVMIELKAEAEVRKAFEGKDLTVEELLEACLNEAKVAETEIYETEVEAIDKRMVRFASSFVHAILLVLGDVHPQAYDFLKTALLEAFPESKKSSGLYQILSRK